MNVERDEDHKRDDENHDCNHTTILLGPNRWPDSEVTDKLWLEGADQLGLPQLHCEGFHAGERGDKGYEPSCTNKAVGRPRDREWSSDGTVPVQGDGGQHVVGGGEGEGLQEL